MFRVKDVYGDIKYSGRSKAKVIDNRDPLSRGRIQVDSPLVGETVWIDYLKVPGHFSVPSIGDIVYIECDTGRYEYPVAWGNVTKGLDSNPDIPDTFKRNIPTNRGLHSPQGHFVELDDGEANPAPSLEGTIVTDKSRGLRITSSSGNKVHLIDENGKSSILIEDPSGNKILVDTENDEIVINSLGNVNNTAGSNYTVTVVDQFSVDSSSTNMTSSGNTVIDASGQLQAAGTGGTDVGDSGSATNVNGQQVNLGGGGQGVARLGDRAVGVGNLGMPVTSTIIQSSFKVFSG